jgi:hypothetical protein
MLPIGNFLFEIFRGGTIDFCVDRAFSLELKPSEIPAEAIADFLIKRRRLKDSDIVHLSYQCVTETLANVF